MKTTVDRSLLLEILQGAMKMSSPQRNASDNKGVLFLFNNNQLTVYGIGETSSFKRTIEISASLFNDETCVTIDHKKLCDFLRGFSANTVDIKIVTGGIVVLVDNTSARFSMSPPAPVPQMEENTEETIPFDPKVVGENLPSLLHCVSSDPSRPTLSSIKLIPQGDNRVLMVSTDGFRLSIIQTAFSIPLPKPLQIPATFLRDIFSGILNVQQKTKLRICGEGKIYFEQEPSTLVGTRLVLGDFPPYERVLLKQFQYNLVFTKTDVVSATKNMSLFAREFSNIIIFEIAGGKCTIRPKKESGLENISVIDVEDCGLAPETNLSIAFNFHYVLDFLSSIDDERFTMRLNKPDSPILFLPGSLNKEDSHEGAAYQHIIMPVRVQE